MSSWLAVNALVLLAMVAQIHLTSSKSTATPKAEPGTAEASESSEQSIYFDEMHYIALRRGPDYHNHSLVMPFHGKWEDYRSLNRVGKGKFSVIYRGRHRSTPALALIVPALRKCIEQAITKPAARSEGIHALRAATLLTSSEVAGAFDAVTLALKEDSFIVNVDAVLLSDINVQVCEDCIAHARAIDHILGDREVITSHRLALSRTLATLMCVASHNVRLEARKCVASVKKHVVGARSSLHAS